VIESHGCGERRLGRLPFDGRGAGVSQARPLLPQLEPKMKIRQFLPAVFTMLVLALASLSATACRAVFMAYTGDQ
jgi:hypothetical protein